MTRDEALKVIEPYIEYANNMRVIHYLDAITILGKERMQRLSRDYTRRQGPTNQTIYVWNILDYLTIPNLINPNNPKWNSPGLGLVQSGNERGI